jgi:hypothetical protein
MKRNLDAASLSTRWIDKRATEGIGEEMLFLCGCCMSGFDREGRIAQDRLDIA